MDSKRFQPRVSHGLSLIIKRLIIINILLIDGRLLNALLTIIKTVTVTDDSAFALHFHKLYLTIYQLEIYLAQPLCHSGTSYR